MTRLTTGFVIAGASLYSTFVYPGDRMKRNPDLARAAGCPTNRFTYPGVTMKQTVTRRLEDLQRQAAASLSAAPTRLTHAEVMAWITWAAGDRQGPPPPEPGEYCGCPLDYRRAIAAIAPEPSEAPAAGVCERCGLPLALVFAYGGNYESQDH